MFSLVSNTDQFIFKLLSKFFLNWTNKIGMTLYFKVVLLKLN